MWERLHAAACGLALAGVVASPAFARPVVVLDPGHGGANPGAPGSVDGVLEKDVTLDIARRAADSLEARGIAVRLTRDGDDNLSLRRRAARANAAGAAAFVSIHCNATPDHDVRGFETYVLSPEAASVQARALRGATGDVRPGLDSAIAAVVRDVERELAGDGARRLAAAIQAELSGVRGAVLDRGVREGAMHVLLGATMPAVLVEVGFIDHPVEGRALADPSVRQEIAEALAAAIAASLAPVPPAAPGQKVLASGDASPR